MKASAVDDGATCENISAQRAHERAVRTKLISSTRPGTSAHELDASEVLLKRDGKDIYKKSAARRNRYAMVFPGQLSALKEGRLGEMREMHTQEPVVYLDFPNGRLKLLGTIVRPKTTRYFTLNAKSKDRMNMEEWFDNVIVFASWYWVGTREENPEETPLALPASLGDLSGEPEVDWESSVAADAGKTSTKVPVATTTTTTTDVKAMGGDKADTTVETGGRRPRRQAATVARKKMYADDSDADVDDDSDEDDDRIASPVVVRGKVESFVPTVPVAAPKPPAPVRQSVTAPVRSSAAAASGRSSLSAPKAPPATRAKKEEPIVIDSDDDDDIEEDSEDEDAMEFDDDSEDDDDDDDDDNDSDSDF